MRCTRCGTNNREGRRFYAQCGQPLKLVCSACGVYNEPGERFCGDCGAALAGHPASTATISPQTASSGPKIRVTPEQPDASTAVEGERKTVTALFADIKGSTELEQDLDPEESRAIVDPALKLRIEAVRRYDGYVAQSTGDGIFAWFGLVAHYGSSTTRALRGAADAGGVRTLFGKIAQARKSADRSARRDEHEGGDGALDHDRLGTDGIHAYRAYQQPSLADANRCANWIHRHRSENPLHRHLANGFANGPCNTG